MGALDDRDLLAEIILLGEVVAAVAEVTQELTDAEVDEVLGVPRVPGAGNRPTSADRGWDAPHRRVAKAPSRRPAG